MLKHNKDKSEYLNSHIRFSDPLLSPLFETDSLFVVNKPYGLTTHTYGDSALQDGVKEIFEKTFKIKLFVIHRLDVTTTGVLVFAKNKEAATKYTEQFASRSVKKRYLFLTGASSSKYAYECFEPIENQNAHTKFNRIKRTAKYELWEAVPVTGRTHQIRKHAKHLGIPILGDQKYGGEDFSVLCLHCEKIDFLEGESYATHPPRYFERIWILHKPQAVKIFIELDRRLRLYNFLTKKFQNQSIRLAHSKKEKYTLDKVGKSLVLSWYDKIETLDSSLWNYIAYHLHQPIYVKCMIDKGLDPRSKSTLWILPKEFEDNSNEPIEVNEDSLKYKVKFDQGHSVGIFLDQRVQRNYVKASSLNKKVLNLFSYTSLFSVCAALGKATSVHSVDLSKVYLDWSRDNFNLNAISLESHMFYARDSFDYLAFCKKNNIKYDIVICDPPSFSRAKDGKVFKVEKDFEKLVLLCCEVLTEKGFILFSTNFEKLSSENLYFKLNIILKGKSFEVKTLVPSLDYEMSTVNADLKSFLITKN